MANRSGMFTVSRTNDYLPGALGYDTFGLGASLDFAHCTFDETSTATRAGSTPDEIPLTRFTCNCFILYNIDRYIISLQLIE